MLLYWIWYAQLRKLSPAMKQRLLEYFRDPEEIYHSEREAFAGVNGITEEALQALEDKNLTLARRILDACAGKGIGIIAFPDDAYPSRLRNTPDAPMVLYYRGTLPDWESIPVIGIVGTRKATFYGMTTANRFGREIAACGALIVSGCAEGIDAMAMQGAMDAGMPVVGVLAGGLDRLYPAKNKRLFAQVLDSGCLISENPPGTRHDGWRFPLRNRIISGISNGLLVVEAPEKSGALSSARHAREQGRDIFVVPANVDVPNGAGSNALLQERATPALSGWHVVREYQALYPGKIHRQAVPSGSQEAVLKVAQEVLLPENSAVSATDTGKKPIDKEEKSTYSVLNEPDPALSEAEQAVLAHISREGCLVDEIIARAQLPAGTVKSVLTKLILKRLIMNHPGGRVSRK